MPIKKLRRIFETAEKGLSRYMHPILKNNKYPTVKEMEMYIELGHSSKDFVNLFDKKKLEERF